MSQPASRNAAVGNLQTRLAMVFVTICGKRTCEDTMVQARCQDFAARGEQNSQGGGTFLKYMLNVCSNRHEKSCLRHVNFIHIQLDTESSTDMNAEPPEHRHLLFCNLRKGRDKK